MAYVVHNGILLPKREVVSRKRAHVRVPHANIILRRPFFPIARPAVGAVAVDVNPGTDGRSGTGVTSFNYTGLIPTGSLTNPAYVFSLSFDTFVTATAVTWNGAACFQILAVNNPNDVAPRLELWGIVSSTPGAHTLAVSWTTAAQVCVAGVSFSGVNQTGGTTSFAHSGSNHNVSGTPTTAATITITSATGNYTYAVFGESGQTGTMTLSQTTVYNDTNINNGTWSSASIATGAASVTHNCTISVADNWLVAGVDIVAAAAAATQVPYTPWPQLGPTLAM